MLLRFGASAMKGTLPFIYFFISFGSPHDITQICLLFFAPVICPTCPYVGYLPHPILEDLACWLCVSKDHTDVSVVQRSGELAAGSVDLKSL